MFWFFLHFLIPLFCFNHLKVSRTDKHAPFLKARDEIKVYCKDFIVNFL